GIAHELSRSPHRRQVQDDRRLDAAVRFLGLETRDNSQGRRVLAVHESELQRRRIEARWAALRPDAVQRSRGAGGDGVGERIDEELAAERLRLAWRVPMMRDGAARSNSGHAPYGTVVGALVRACDVTCP